MPTSSVTSSPLVGGEELGVCELVTQVSHPVTMPVVLCTHVLRNLRPAFAGTAHLLWRTRLLGLRWLDRPGPAFFRQISRNQVRQQVAVPDNPMVTVGRPVCTRVIEAEHTVVVIGDAVDATAIDFDVGKDAVVLGLQGRFHEIGCMSCTYLAAPIFRLPRRNIPAAR
jgi:hypothetical protein